MPVKILAVGVEALDRLLTDVVDTREKLEVLVCLRESSGNLTTATIAARVGLSWVVVAEALGELHRAGLVETCADDGAGWWLDDFSPWYDVIGLLAHFYERDRTVLLRRMARVALQQLRAVRRTDIPPVIRLRFKVEP